MIIKSNETENYLSLASEILSWKDANIVVSAILKKFYKDEFNAESYADFNSAPRREPRENREPREPRESRGFETSNESWMSRLFVARWKLDWFQNPGNLLSFIAKECGLWDLWAWKVDILTNFSYIDLPHDIANIVLDEFKNKNSAKPLVVKAKQKTDDRDGSDRGGYRWGWRSGGFSSERSSSYKPRSSWSDRGGYRGGNSDRKPRSSWYRGKND